MIAPGIDETAPTSSSDQSMPPGRWPRRRRPRPRCRRPGSCRSPSRAAAAPTAGGPAPGACSRSTRSGRRSLRRQRLRQPRRVCPGAPAGFGSGAFRRRSRSRPNATRDEPITIRRAFAGRTVAAYPPATAPATDGTIIHPVRRRSIRPARTWRTAAVAAATPETAIFAPAAAAGEEPAARSTGSRMFPSTSPRRPPASATTTPDAHPDQQQGVHRLNKTR